MTSRKKYQLWYGRILTLGLVLIVCVAAPVTAKTVIGRSSSQNQVGNPSETSELAAPPTGTPPQSSLPLNSPTQSASPELFPTLIDPTATLADDAVPTAADLGTSAAAETSAALPIVTSTQDMALPSEDTLAATVPTVALSDGLTPIATADMILPATIPPAATTPTSDFSPTIDLTSLASPIQIATVTADVGPGSLSDVKATSVETSTVTLTPSPLPQSTPTLLASPTLTATATITSTDISTIATSPLEGRLEFTADVELAVAVRLNGQDQAVAGSFPIIVNDTRQLRSGWKLMITMTQFRLNGANNHSLPPSVATISYVDAACNQSGCILPQNTISYPLYIFDQATPLTFFVAESVTGLGSFIVTPHFQLRVPANAYAGHYTAAIQLTIADGP